MAKKMTNDQKTMRKVARKIKTIMDKDLSALEDATTKGWFVYILKDVYNFVTSASEGVQDAEVANLVSLAGEPPPGILGEDGSPLEGEEQS